MVKVERYPTGICPDQLDVRIVLRAVHYLSLSPAR
jgi:hypothetical protein